MVEDEGRPGWLTAASLLTSKAAAPRLPCRARQLPPATTDRHSVLGPKLPPIGGTISRMSAGVDADPAA